LNVLLAGITAAGAYRLRQDWLHDHQHSSTVLEAHVKPVPPPALKPVPAPPPFAAPTYADVAQKDLFSKDRNPNIVLPPVVVKAKPKWPNFPILYGVMGLPGGMIAMLAEAPNARSRGVQVGEKIGELKMVGLNSQKITFEFEGETQEKNILDLVDRGGHEEANAAATSLNPANVAANRIGPPPIPKPGTDIGTQMKACQPGDVSPAGTVVDGYKKVLEQTPFGPACRWVQ
jgi:hypothetical protein